MAQQPQKMSREQRCQQTKARNERRRAERRAEAEARNAEWRKLSPKEQLAELKKRPGKSKKQVAKIRKKLKQS